MSDEDSWRGDRPEPILVRPLLERAQALTMQYWRIGPGSPAGLPHLNDAIEALEKAYGCLNTGDTVRGLAAAQLGWLLGTRRLVHGGPAHDGEAGIPLLEEGLATPRLPPVWRLMAGTTLGQLHLTVALQALQSGDLAMLAASGIAPSQTASADRAIDCFRRLLAEPQLSAEATDAVRTMLTVAEAAQTMMSSLGGGLRGLDFGRLMEAMTALQGWRQRAGAAMSPTAGVAAMPPLFDADEVARRDPLDRPVMVVDGPAPAPSGVPRPRRREAVPVDLAALRLSLREKLAAGVDLYPSVEALLASTAPDPERGAVDDLVALAMSVVHGGGTAGTDQLLLAVALHLRDRIDDAGGWDDAGGDARAAAESLFAAAEALPAEEPAALPVALRLATLLDAQDPAGQVCQGMADRLGGVTEALRTVGADALAYPRPDGTLLLGAAPSRLRLAPPGAELPARILVVGDEPAPLGHSVVSSVASSAQVLDLARRTRLRITEDPVFLANPRGDRESASVDAMLLRRTFYPWSTGLGRTIENVDGPGTPDEVLAHLGASMLHVGCGVSAAGALELAGAAELDAAVLAGTGKGGATGGLVILPPVRGAFPALADAFLAAGFVGAIGWLRPVPDNIAALMLFLVHVELVDHGHDPATAVQAVQRWMRDPEREPPSSLPGGYAATLGAVDLTDQCYWSALAHRGG